MKLIERPHHETHYMRAGCGCGAGWYSRLHRFDLWMGRRRVRSGLRIKIPSGYRDWQLVSINHLAADNMKQVRAQLGNDIAVKAFRDGTLPFPDSAVIVALTGNNAVTPTATSV
jgi:hypothetical protein